MTDYIKKADAYRIALHDGGPVCAEKIAQLEPLKINLWPDVTDPNIIRQLPTITIDIKPATLNPKTLSWGGVDLEEDERIEGGFSGGVSDEITKACERYLESARAAERIAAEEDLNRRRRELEKIKTELRKVRKEVGTVNVKSSIDGEWKGMPADEFFRMLEDKTMMEGKRWPEH